MTHSTDSTPTDPGLRGWSPTRGGSLPVTRPPKPTLDPDFSDPWPAFLDRLSSDPQRAFDAFYRFAKKVFRRFPPRAHGSMTREDREDAVHDVIYHCCRNDFRVLRAYTDHGKPFSCWLRQVAQRKALDSFRAQQHDPVVPVATDFDLGEAPEIDENARIDMQRAIEATLECLGSLDEESRLLLLAAAEGRRPLEITRLLGWPRTENQRVADRYRYCRQKLKKMLRERGIDLAELISGKR